MNKKHSINIKHEPLFDTAKIEAHYTKQDGVPVKYVCTTDLRASDVPVDVFYRSTPHPEFGNRYFGLYYDNVRGHLMITNADVVEELDFGMIESDGMLHYSQSHHDYKQLNEAGFIDGGRSYCRSSSNVEFYKVMNGVFVRNRGDELANWLDTKDDEYVYPGGDCQL
jgi:hypothetical protein